MTFRVRILAALLTVGIVPAGLVGLATFSATTSEVTALTGRLEARHAEELARHCELVLSNAAAALQLAAGYIPFDQLTADELRDVLALPQRQYPAFTAVGFFDQAGRPRVPTLRDDANDPSSPLRGGPGLPVARALARGMAFSEPWRTPDGRPRVVVAVRVEARAPGLLAAELDLGELTARLVEASRDGGVAALVDRHARLLAGSGAVAGALGPDAASAGAGVHRLPGSDGHDWLAASAELTGVGWTAVVAQPAAVALVAATRVRDWSLGWLLLAVLVAAAAGTSLARSLERPVRALSAAAEDLTRGAYDRTVQVSGPVELERFAAAFNHMAREIRRRDGEIRAWSTELERRVDEKTRDLRAAQDQIFRTRRLAAIASLGAGMAHELNNPLTALLGLVALLKADAGRTPNLATLDAVSDQARRVARVISDLRQFADAEQSQAGSRFSVAVALEAGLRVEASRLAQQGVKVVRAIPARLPEVQGDAGQISQVVAHLVRNAANAMPDGGELLLGVESLDGEAVRLTVRDTGRGIPAHLRERVFDPFFTTKDAAGQVGMGLAICHTIVTAHHGRIAIDSDEGRGTRVDVLLPVAASAHLA